MSILEVYDFFFLNVALILKQCQLVLFLFF